MLLNYGEIDPKELRYATILLASGSPSGVSSLVPVLQRFAGTVLTAHGLSDFERMVRRAPEPAVVLSDPAIEGGEWQDVLRHCRALPVPPCFILAVASPDAALWADLYKLGGFDLLVQPWSEPAVERVVSIAAKRWKRSRQIAQARSEGAKSVFNPLENT